jgi:hypothetical protein
MSRPRKLRPEPIDRRAIDEPGETPLAHIARQAFLDELRAAPFNDEALATVLAGTLLGRADDGGELLAEAARKLSPDQLAGMFHRVSRMKNDTAQPHRNALAYLAYCRFIEATGREPSKPELREYLTARPEAFKGMPPGDDKKAWNRLWKDCGLFTLADR